MKLRFYQKQDLFLSIESKEFYLTLGKLFNVDATNYLTNDFQLERNILTFLKA